jgi:hypothetical protein
MMSNWKVGDIARTPWEPSGLVKILELEPAGTIYDECAFVVFIEDHPNGYRNGEPGRYQLKELRAAETIKGG